jgi:hypothetical protein
MASELSVQTAVLTPERAGSRYHDLVGILMIFVVVSAALVDRDSPVPSERAVFELWHLNGNPVHLRWYQRLRCI